MNIFMSFPYEEKLWVVRHNVLIIRLESCIVISQFPRWMVASGGKGLRKALLARIIDVVMSRWFATQM